MAKYINIITFLYFSIPQMTQKALKNNDIQKIFAPCGRVGGNHPRTLSTIKFQHLLVLSFSFKKMICL